MIKYIKLRNFFSFKEQKIDIGNINVLIGINASGKSNLIKSFELLKEGARGNLHRLIVEKWGGFDAIFFTGENSSTNERYFEIEIAFDSDLSYFGFIFPKNIVYKIRVTKTSGTDNYFVSECLGYENEDCNFAFGNLLNVNNGKGFVLKIDKNGKLYYDKINNKGQLKERRFDAREIALSTAFDSEFYPHINAVSAAMKDIAIYPYFDTSPTGNIRKSTNATGDKILASDGGNLAMILNTVKLKDKTAYKQIVNYLKDINPYFNGIDINVFGNSGKIELMLDEEKLNASVHLAHISDGTLKFLCLLAILFNPEKSKFIIIEEPETGLHPDMISLIAKGIKAASGEASFLLTTQSEKFLDQFDLENLMVVEKSKENFSIVKTFKDSDFKQWYDNYFLGEMWSKGDLGGTRW